MSANTICAGKELPPMNRSDRLAVTVVGYSAIGIIALPIALVASFITWGSVLLSLIHISEPTRPY